MAFTGLHLVYLGGVHNPDHWASVFGIFIFRTCIVLHLRLFLLLSSQPLFLIEYLRFGRVWCDGGCLDDPYPHHCPPPVWSIGLRCCLWQASIFFAIHIPNLLSVSIAGFQPHFIGGAPACRVSDVPCSSRLLVCYRCSGALYLLPIIRQDAQVGVPVKILSLFYFTGSCHWSCRCSAEEKR